MFKNKSYKLFITLTFAFMFSLQNAQCSIIDEAENGNTEAVLALLDEGIDINSMNNEHQTALHLASLHGHIDTVTALIEGGATITEDLDRETPLHYAVLGDHANIIEYLLTLPNNQANIESTNSGGYTPLHYAASQQCINAILILLTHGANILAQDDHGNTALYYIAISTDPENLRILLDNRADLHYARDHNNNTMLNIARDYQAHANTTMENGGDEDEIEQMKRFLKNAPEIIDILEHHVPQREAEARQALQDTPLPTALTDIVCDYLYAQRTPPTTTASR